jgi:hypothetical protein
MPPPRRSPLSVAGTFFGLFIGGAAAGLGLARLLAPGSWWAEALSTFAFPVAFAFGLQAWFGLAILGLIPHLARRLLHDAGAPSRPRTDAPLPGAAVFLPIASGTGALLGFVVGWISSTHSVWLVAPVYWSAGTAYGWLAWRLARAGFLMPPESI